jgi:large subunit ribosomal protein L35
VQAPRLHRRVLRRAGRLNSTAEFATLANRIEEEIVKKNKKKKLKTHRGAAKRFKITSTGKIMRWHSGKRHLLGTKKPRRMRKLANAVVVNPSDVRNIRLALPYGIE